MVVSKGVSVTKLPQKIATPEITLLSPGDEVVVAPWGFRGVLPLATARSTW